MDNVSFIFLFFRDTSHIYIYISMYDPPPFSSDTQQMQTYVSYPPPQLT